MDSVQAISDRLPKSSVHELRVPSSHKGWRCVCLASNRVLGIVMATKAKVTMSRSSVIGAEASIVELCSPVVFRSAKCSINELPPTLGFHSQGKNLIDDRLSPQNISTDMVEFSYF